MDKQLYKTMEFIEPDFLEVIAYNQAVIDFPKDIVRYATKAEDALGADIVVEFKTGEVKRFIQVKGVNDGETLHFVVNDTKKQGNIKAGFMIENQGNYELWGIHLVTHEITKMYSRAIRRTMIRDRQRDIRYAYRMAEQEKGGDDESNK